MPKRFRYSSKRATKTTSLFKPRTRLAGALRKLGKALAEDHREFAENIRKFAARFHDYSPFNRLLIWGQRPDATFVKGRKQWLEQHGRTVRPGAKAIYILAPLLKKGEKGPAEFFATIQVYDVSDTEGPPLNIPFTGQIAGDEEKVLSVLAQLEQWVLRSGLELLDRAPAGVNQLVWGATDGKRIWILPGLQPRERAAVLAHEIAHVKLHFAPKMRGQGLLVDYPEQPLTRNAKELEAELTSFLLLELAGIDSSLSAGMYLNSWQATRKEIHARAERCLVAACSVLRDCERQRYRKLVTSGTPSQRADLRAALS